MQTDKKSSLLRYGVAVLAALIGVIPRLLLTPLVGADVPFITLFPAVAASALFGGLGPGLVTTFIGALAANFFILNSFAFSFSEPKEIVQMILFLVMGGFISWAISERGSFISWAISERDRVEAYVEQLKIESEKQARETLDALRKSEKRSQLTQRTVGVGVWEWDLKTDEVEWSEGIYELLGLEASSEKIFSKKWLEFIVPEDRERATGYIQRLIDGEYDEFYDEFRIRRRDGAIRWITSQGQIMRGADKRAVRLLGLNFDITERKKTELEIKHLNQELNRRIRELQTIFDIAPVGIAVAHDPNCDVSSAR
jgi:PAS domain S-box-containing protein